MACTFVTSESQRNVTLYVSLKYIFIKIFMIYLTISKYNNKLNLCIVLERDLYDYFGSHSPSCDHELCSKPFSLQFVGK